MTINRLPRPALRRLGPWVGFALLLAALPVVTPSGFALSLASQAAIAIVFALSFNMLLGETGLFSFGHSVFMGLGGFVTIHALRIVEAEHLAVPLAALPLAGAAGGLFFGLVLGWPATRRSGTAFVMITLGLSELISASAYVFIDFFGAEKGVTADRTMAAPFWGLDFASQNQVYWLIAVWAFVSVVAIYALTRTPLGRMANATRDNTERVTFIGYSAAHIRFVMFALASLFAGIAGGLSAINYEIVTAASLGLQAGSMPIVMSFIGGVRHFAGPVLGAVLITFLQGNLANYTEAWLLYLGILFVFVIVFVPEGITGFVLRHGPLLRAGLLHRVLPLYTLVLVPSFACLCGLVVLVEAAWRLSVAADKGTMLRLLGVTVDAAAGLTWLVGLALCVAGIVGVRWAARVIGPRWEEASHAASQGR
jgi:branched-chain amino acid transport system permease protein